MTRSWKYVSVREKKARCEHSELAKRGIIFEGKTHNNVELSEGVRVCMRASVERKTICSQMRRRAVFDDGVSDRRRRNEQFFGIEN